MYIGEIFEVLVTGRQVVTGVVAIRDELGKEIREKVS
jgi:hypothetical protein